MAPNVYVAVSDVLTALGSQVYPLLDDSQLRVEDGDDISDHGKLLAAVEVANDTVDAYLRGQYTLPLASVPASLRSAAVAIVHYELIRSHPELDQDREKSAFDRAMAYLRELSSGKARLDISPTTQTTAPAPATLARLGSNVTRDGVDRETLTSPSWIQDY